jgi:hypothetical protein
VRTPFSCYAPIQMNQISTPSLPIVTTSLSSVATAAITRLHLLRILKMKKRSCLPGSSSTKQSNTSRERYGSTEWKLMMQMMTILSTTSRSAQLGMLHRCVFSLVNHVVFIIVMKIILVIIWIAEHRITATSRETSHCTPDRLDLPTWADLQTRHKSRPGTASGTLGRGRSPPMTPKTCGRSFPRATRFS